MKLSQKQKRTRVSGLNSKPDRSAIMRSVRARDTKPELLVRKLAHAIRPGYRLHRKDIPGNPDIAYVGRRQAIFVNGCFWHGHDCARGARVPKANREYWLGKVERNRQRDAKNQTLLEAEGWRSFVIWECELKDEGELTRRLSAFLS
jgi:DNA mismatch endonuclease (patch repair protein)